MTVKNEKIELSKEQAKRILDLLIIGEMLSVQDHSQFLDFRTEANKLEKQLKEN